MNFTRINMSGIPDDVLFLINTIVIGVIILCAALVAVTNYRDKVRDRLRKENTLRSARADESGAGTGRLSAPIDLEGPERRKAPATGSQTQGEAWAVRDWVHPAVRRGTIYWTAHGIVSAGLAVALVFLALRNPSTELRLWAIAAVIFAVLAGFLVRKQIKNLRHEYRYEEDDDTTDQS